MTNLNVTRRGFVIGGAAAGLSLGMSVPFGGNKALAQVGFPDEINAWVVIKPDDTVVIRIARSEMGQGSLTGLAQLVAEELQCDWDKVTTEYPTPATNLERGRVWQSFSTGGSRGIRESNDYVRQGGAAAREMLIAAAAKEWGVPAAECKAEKSVITHAGSGKSTTYGKVAVRGLEDGGAEGRQAEGPEGLDHRRQAGEAARHGRQAGRQADLRRGHPICREC